MTVVRRGSCVFGLALLAGVGGGCERQFGSWEPPPGPAIDAELRAALSRWGIMPIGEVAAPPNPALVTLGQALMFDKILSGNKDIACATCHLPQASLTDGLSLSVGTGGTGLGTGRTLGPGREFHARSAPTLLNSGIGLNYVFWDGRVSGWGTGPFNTPAGTRLPAGLPNVMAAQAMFPVLSRQEMRGDSGDVDVFGNVNELAQFADSQLTETWAAVMQRLLAIPEYVTMFQAAFPGTPASSLGFQHAATAIAAFELYAFTRATTPFDRYLERNDEALTPTAKRGALLFFGDTTARCVSCHSGPFLGGRGFANIGAPQLGPGTGAGAPLDFGFGEVSGQPAYNFAFRVAPLRNIELTAPYMHNGAYATLEAVVRHYNNVPLALRSYDASQLAPAIQGTVHLDDATIDALLANLDSRLRTPLDLSDAQVLDLVEFLKALTDPAARNLTGVIPARVPSGLSIQD